MKDEYPESAFKRRPDFNFVVAWNVGKIPSLMFNKAANLEALFAPNVEEIEGGYDEDFDFYGAFTHSSISHLYCPKLKVIGWHAFHGTNLQELDLPILTTIEYFGVCGCPLQTLSLPSL